jgi:hypothetical protein
MSRYRWINASTSRARASIGMVSWLSGSVSQTHCQALSLDINLHVYFFATWASSLALSLWHGLFALAVLPVRNVTSSANTAQMVWRGLCILSSILRCQLLHYTKDGGRTRFKYALVCTAKLSRMSERIKACTKSVIIDLIIKQSPIVQRIPRLIIHLTKTINEESLVCSIGPRCL